MARKRRSTRKRSTARRTTARRAAPRRRRRTLRKSRVVRVRRRTAAGRLRAVKRRSYRRNPPFSMRAIMGNLVDAGQVTAGKVGFNLLQRNLPLPLPIGGVAGEALKGLIVAGVGSYAAGMLVKGALGKNIVVGIYQGFLEGMLRQVNVPVVSQALGEYDVGRGRYNSLGNYPRAALPAPSMGSYPVASFDDASHAYNGQ